MAKLYYGTDEFDVPEFANRRVIDEIKMSMSAFDCVLPDDAGIYCSSDITTGKKFYYDVLGKNGVRSEVELKEKLGDEEFKKVQTELIQFNVARGVEFSEKLRERGLNNVVTPGPYFARGFDQQHYLYLWEWFIIKKIYEVRFNYDWEYSNGCTLEYAIAAKKGIPRLDHEGSNIDLKSAIERVKVALAELRNEEFLVTKLENNLTLLEDIQQ
ncbi:MAG TPA: hypothetical protein VGO56_16775 [Pyrinomonadaceae bacterium]|jgi:hypothetical protein|nr:hypothetical protein [Pyrinomonadaceae bacterium]